MTETIESGSPLDAAADRLHLSRDEAEAFLRQDLTGFIAHSFDELYPGRPLTLAPYIRLLATKLEAVRRGEIKRLIVNLPPRRLKSHCASIAFPAWVLGHDRTKKILCISYGQSLADEFAEGLPLPYVQSKLSQTFWRRSCHASFKRQPANDGGWRALGKLRRRRPHGTRSGSRDYR